MAFRNSTKNTDHAGFARKRSSSNRAGAEDFSFDKNQKNSAPEQNSFVDSPPAEKKFAASSSARSVRSEPNYSLKSKKKSLTDFFTRPKITAFSDNEADIAAADKKISVRPIENWLQRRGHTLTFAFLMAFTFVLYFRPYEMIPALAAFSSIAFFLAIGTLLIFVPSQVATENTLTARPPEINYVLIIMGFGLLTVPIARDPALAWATFNDPFIKVVLMFVVMVNVVRTKLRLKLLIWLAMSVGVMLAFSGIGNYASGKDLVEGYRASADIAGMFGNPNSQAMHYVMIAPIAVAFGLATRNYLFKMLYFSAAILFVCGNVTTFSRGGFLGLIVAALVLAWKFGRGRRFQVMGLCLVIGALFIALAPGNYGIRILSIFIPGLDPVGSNSQRSGLFWTSLLVTARNPWGIGMNNFILTNPNNLLTHNSYTQISSELGVVPFFAYIMFIFEPLRRLFWIESEMIEKKSDNWMYYLSVGLQSSLAGYCVCSFFDAAAYQWFLYYLVAYAVCLRRIYQLEKTAY